MALLNIEERIASVSILEDEVTGLILGSRLSVEPRAAEIVAGTYPVRLVWGFSGVTSDSVEAELEI